MCFLFFLMHPAPTDIYTLSLHDALPISGIKNLSTIGFGVPVFGVFADDNKPRFRDGKPWPDSILDGEGRGREAGYEARSEEHTSELQSHVNLVCRLLLEKKKKHNNQSMR